MVSSVTLFYVNFLQACVVKLKLTVLQDNVGHQLCRQDEFLRLCICPYLHQMFHVVDGVPQFSATATSMTTLLVVVVESLHGCDWPMLSSCAPIPLLLCVSRLLNASRFSSESSSIVRERAVSVLNKLVQLLQKHVDNVPGKFSTFIYLIYINSGCKF